MTGRLILFALPLAVAAGGTTSAHADRMTIARELAESALRRLGGGVAREGGEALAGRLAATAARHGDDLVMGAFRRIGPRALSISDEAGEAIAPNALRFIARHGDDAAAVLTGRSIKLLPLGEAAADMLIKHRGVSLPLLEAFGNSATRALSKIGPRSGRRLAMLKDNLLRAGKAKRLLEVIGKYGDPAMDWVWEHKAQLAATAAMAAFLADPEPYLDGTRRLAETTAASLVVPVTGKVIDAGTKVAECVVSGAVQPVVTELSREAARRLPWATIGVLGLLGLVALATRLLLARRSRSAGGAA